MRLVSIAAVALIWGGTATAQDYSSGTYCSPWCKMGGGGGLECAFHTFDQCLVSTRGAGGHCYENPFLSLCTRPGVAAKPLRPRRH